MIDAFLTIFTWFFFISGVVAWGFFILGLLMFLALNPNGRE